MNDVLKIGHEMIVMVKRNGKTLFWKQNSWNPEKEPIRAVGVLNKVSVGITPETRSWLKISVKVWNGQKRKQVKLEPRIVEGHLEFQARERITIRIFDNKNKKFRELLAHWVKDKNGTQYPVLEIGPEKPLCGEERLSAKIEIPKIVIADESKFEKTMVENQIDKSPKNNGKRRIRNGHEEKQKHPRKHHHQEKFNPNGFKGLSYERVKEVSTAIN